MNRAELRKRALESALMEIFFTDTIGHCHVEEAVECLLSLPSPAIKEVLNQVRLVAYSVSDLLAFSLMENVEEALRFLPLHRLGDWVKGALDAYESGGLQEAKEFLENPSTTALAYSCSPSVATLEAFVPGIKLLAAGMTGASREIKPAPAPFTDGLRLFLPPSLATLPTRDENMLLYRVMAVMACSQLRYRSFHLPMDDTVSALGGDILEKPDSAMELLLSRAEGREEEFVALFCALEEVRMTPLLKREFPGLYAEIRVLKERLVDAVPLPSPSSLGPAIALWLLSNGKRLERPLKPWVEELEGLKGHGSPLGSGLLALAMAAAGGLEPPPLLPYLPVPPHQRLIQGLRDETELRQKRFIELFRLVVLDLQRRSHRLSRGERQPSLPPGIRQALGLIIPPGEAEGGGVEPPLSLLLDSPPLSDEHRQLIELSKELERDKGGIPQGLWSAAVGAATKAWSPWMRGVESPDLHAPHENRRVFLYDEWDFRRGAYRKEWCHLKEKGIEGKGGEFVDQVMERYRGEIRLLRRQFELLRPERRILRRQQEGDEIDIDALVEAHTDIIARGEASDAVFKCHRRKDRDIVLSFLIDMSASTEGWINKALKEALVLMCEALEAVGDPYSIYGFSGMRRTNCQFFEIKRMDQPYSQEIKDRIGAINARDYTRMGPALRHATSILKQTSSKLKVLLILSDGKPEDYDEYKGPYALEDTRRAVIEARMANIRPFCITIDRDRREYLPRLFGDHGYIFVKEVSRLPWKVPQIYRVLTT